MNSTDNPMNRPNPFLKYALLVICFLLAAFLLRFIPITILTQQLVGGGLSQDQAIQQASAFIMEDPLTMNLLGAIQGLFWFLIVFILVVRLEKRSFHWKDFGLDWRSSTPASMGFGVLLGIALVAAYIFTGRLFEPTPVTWTALPVPIVLLILLNYFTIGFGEELAFRAFLQDRLIARFKSGIGVVLTAICFVPLHLLVQSMNLTTLISGLLLWCAIGALYYSTRSLFLVGALHMVLNALPIFFDLEVNPMAGLMVHALALAMVVLLLRRSQKLRKVSVA